MTTHEDDMEEGFDELGFLMITFAGMVWRGATAEEAIGQIAKSGASLAPEMAAGIDPGAGVTEFFRLVGRGMWNATPQPAHGFRLTKLPEPGRNDPCFCGSGRKFKHCCSGMPEFPLHPSLMLSRLLMAMPRKHWQMLAHSQVNREWVLAVVVGWQKEGDFESIVDLLEPWFKGENAIRDQDAELLDCLLDAYADLDKPRKRKMLAKEAIERGERQAKYVGWQRLALMEMDAGNFSASHHALKEAMRAAPDAADLGPLEVMLLIGEGKNQLARDRAQFWLAKMARLRDPELQQGMDWLRSVVEDPDQAMMDVAQANDPHVDLLSKLIVTAPPPKCHYRIEPVENSTGPFMPEPDLVKALSAWEKAFPVSQPSLTHPTSWNTEAWIDAPRWLPLLQKQPILWHSFEVLDDLVCALDGYESLGASAVLIPKLLNRGSMLFDLVLSGSNAEGLKCEWGWIENRPALRLLARRAVDEADSIDPVRREAAFELKRRMVEVLNPHDNHGFRAAVVGGLIARGKSEEAILLAGRYPDDFADMKFNLVLAHYANGQMDEAQRIAVDALREHPRVGRMLLAASPKMPRMDEHGYRIGSDQEAWLYREEFRSLWEGQKALDWLSGIARKAK